MYLTTLELDLDKETEPQVETAPETADDEEYCWGEARYAQSLAPRRFASNQPRPETGRRQWSENVNRSNFRILG